MPRTAERPELTGEVLYKAYKDAEGNVKRTKQEVATFHRLTYGQAAGRIWRYLQTLEEDAPPENEKLFSVSLGQPLELDGDWLVVNDVHAPTVDMDMARLVVPAARAAGVTNLLINGDLINADWLSGYPVLIAHPTASQEIAAAAYLVAEWLRHFERVVIVPGNHEDRFLKANVGNLDFGNLIRLLTTSDRVEYSNFDHCWLDSPVGRWFIAHGKHYSVNQLVVADQYAQKYQAHICLGHQHHLAQGWDRWKRYMLIDNGGLFAPDKMTYVSARASKMSGMKPGFTIIKAGVPQLYGPEPMTDWRAVLESPELAA